MSNGWRGFSENEEKAHLLKSLIGTQSLAVVQLLLELCDGEVDERPELREIREVACAQIHQMFIADSLLAKLVHFNVNTLPKSYLHPHSLTPSIFQTYSIRLIPVVVELVPSAHLLIGNIDELLVADSLERRVFGVTLMAHLVHKYRIPAAFAGVDLTLNLIETLLSCSANSEHVNMFAALMPALKLLTVASPFHADTVRRMLERARTMCRSRIALSRSHIWADESKERRLVKDIDSCLMNGSQQ